MYTLVFNDAELDVIYDALDQLGISIDDEDESETIGSILNKIHSVVKGNTNVWHCDCGWIV